VPEGDRRTSSGGSQERLAAYVNAVATARGQGERGPQESVFRLTTFYFS